MGNETKSDSTYFPWASQLLIILTNPFKMKLVQTLRLERLCVQILCDIHHSLDTIYAEYRAYQLKYFFGRQQRWGYYENVTISENNIIFNIYINLVDIYNKFT